MSTIKDDIAEAYYNKGMADFREFLKNLYGMTAQEIYKLYYEHTPKAVICDTTYTPSELMSMYDVWTNINKIKVGDEISFRLSDYRDDIYAWVYKIDKVINRIYAMDSDGNNYYVINEKVTKTGRHCEDIPKLVDTLKSLQRTEEGK